jgi:predicted nucleotidyltransferase
MRTAGLLRRVTSLIVTACDPETIILFGSYAKGQQNRDSDLDILVIGDFRGSSVLRDHELRQLLHTCPIRIEVHIATAQEVTAESAKPFSFLNSVVSSGVVLYASSRASQRPLDTGAKA